MFKPCKSNAHKYLKLKLSVFNEEGVSHIYTVGSQIAAHTLMETGNGPNEPNTINL